MSNAFNTINSFLTYTSLLGQQGGGSGNVSNWSLYPAVSNVQMSNWTLSNTQIDNSGSSMVKPLVSYFGDVSLNGATACAFNLVHTNGGGSNQPSTFPVSRFTYLKNDPFNRPEEPFSLITLYDTAGAGWTITSVWEGYIGMPLTLGGTPLIFSVGGNDSQQIQLTSTNGGSGLLWVDSNGALYWNSNLIANP